MGLNENIQIIQTVLDKDGNLRKKNAVDYKEIKILALTQNPFVWTEVLKKDTDNLNEDFVKKVHNKIKEDFGVDTLKVFIERVQAKDIACWNNTDLERL